MPRRTAFNKVQQLTVWQRDTWHCRYCLEAVLFGPAIQLLDPLNPGHGYYQPHGKHGAMLRLFAIRWASVDHILPVIQGGDDSFDNLATSCMECNIAKNASAPSPERPLREVPDEIVSLNWDGLMRLYPLLVDAPNEWTRAIEQAAPQPHGS